MKLLKVRPISLKVYDEISEEYPIYWGLVEVEYEDSPLKAIGLGNLFKYTVKVKVFKHYWYDRYWTDDSGEEYEISDEELKPLRGSVSSFKED